MGIDNNTYKNIEYCIRCGGKLSLCNDREGKLRPVCPDCDWTYYKNPVPAAACVVLNNNNEILIIKRKFAPAAGQWALPSGYIEIDQTPEDAAVSELSEETGLVGSIVSLIDYFTGYSPLYESIISFGFLLKVTGGSLRAGDDAAEACYVDIAKLPPIAFAAHRHYIDIVTKMI